MVFPWELRKLDKTGVVIESWSSSTPSTASLGIGGFEWSNDKYGSNQVLTFSINAASLTFNLGDYIELAVDYNSSGTLTTLVFGIVVEIPNPNRGETGTVRVVGGMEILKGILLSKSYPESTLATVIADLLTYVPSLFTVVLNDSTSWSDTTFAVTFSNVTLLEALEYMIKFKGGIVHIRNRDIYIRNSYAFTTTSPGRVVKDQISAEPPYNAVRVVLQRNFATIDEVFGSQNRSDSRDALYIANHSAYQTVIIDQTQYDSNPYTVAVSPEGTNSSIDPYIIRDIDIPVTTIIPTYLYQRDLLNQNMQGSIQVSNNATSNMTNYFSKAINKTSSTTYNYTSIVPHNTTVSTSYAIIGMLYEVQIQRITDPTNTLWNMSVVLGAGRNPGVGTLPNWNGEPFKTSLGTSSLDVTTDEEWVDTGGHNIQGKLFIQNVEANPTATFLYVYGEMYTGYRNASAIQPSTLNAWVPIIGIGTTNSTSTTYRIYPKITYLTTSLEQINTVIQTKAPPREPGYSLVYPGSYTSGWTTLDVAGYPSLNVDHYEYSMTPDTGFVSRVFGGSAVNKSLVRQISYAQSRELI